MSSTPSLQNQTPHPSVPVTSQPGKRQRGYTTSIFVVLASLFLSMSCGGTQQGESGQSESLTDSSSQGQAETRPTANHMPYLDDRWPEGKNPMLDLSKGYEMYVLVDSDVEGTPVQIHVDAPRDPDPEVVDEYTINARTPYYVEVQPRNKYGNVGSGSISAYNGNTDGAKIYVTLYIGSLLE